MSAAKRIRPETLAPACPPVPAAVLDRVLPQSWIEDLERNQKLPSCCRHPENHTIEALKTHPREPMADIYVFTCTAEHRLFVFPADMEIPAHIMAYADRRIVEEEEIDRGGRRRVKAVYGWARHRRLCVGETDIRPIWPVTVPADTDGMEQVCPRVPLAAVAHVLPPQWRDGLPEGTEIEAVATPNAAGPEAYVFHVPDAGRSVRMAEPGPGLRPVWNRSIRFRPSRF